MAVLQNKSISYLDDGSSLLIIKNPHIIIRRLYAIDFIMPYVDTFRSDDENSIESRTSEIYDIIEWGDSPDSIDVGDFQTRHDQLTKCYKWCDGKYPGTKSNDWPDIASTAGEDVDIRPLMRAHSTASYAILLFLEAF